MQIIADVPKRLQEVVAENATTILTAGGVVGTVVTGVLSWRSGYTTAEKVLGRDFEAVNDVEESEEVDTLSTKDKVIIALPTATPAVITGGATIAAIIFSHRMSAQKAAALAAAYGLSQKQLEEYKGKVAEKLGLQKEQKIRDEIAQDNVTNTPGYNNIVIVEGEVLCFDKPTGRYFKSTMESINRAVNSTNAEILNHDYADASFFYAELEMPPTTWTDDVGWASPEQVALSISTVLTPDDKPCIAIDFQTLPHPDFIRRSY